MTFVSQLSPPQVWSHFDRILTIPRGSKNEAGMAEYVKSVAAANGLEFEQDEAGNIVVRKPAADGVASTAPTILQSHLDMVNEKNADVEHDFEKDPIVPQRSDGYLTASGTTLGSDNGIGVATSLALMDDRRLKHGPLELLFTVDEETGLTGAAGLRSDFLKGRRLINLDTEEEGALYVGCAGGAGVNIDLPLTFSRTPEGASAKRVKLKGLRGGHSGVDIHLQRGNAIKLLARALAGAADTVPYRLASLQGGNMHNAVPREASALVLLKGSTEQDFQKSIEREFQALALEFGPAEPDMNWTLEGEKTPEQVLDPASQQTVLNLLNALPHGVATYSYDIPDLVETSSNLATAAGLGGRFKVHVSNRSSVASALDGVQRQVAAIGLLAGADVESDEGYPGWKPNMQSELLKVARRVYQRRFDKEPAVKAVHAGLECGIIGEKYPGMDMISLGPQIEFPHSPDERVRIESVDDFYQALGEILEELARG